MKYRIIFRTAILLIFCFFLLFQTESFPDKRIPKNIILFIGDGMGIGHITAAKTTKGTLNLEEFKTMGLLTPHACDAFIVSSMSSTTALATGVQTKKGCLAISPSGKPLKTVLEYAEEKGKSTGLITTASITDATPACFASHGNDRKAESIIAEQITASGVDVLFGGGLSFFIPQSTKGSSRKDEKNLIAELRKRYEVVTTSEGFREIKSPEGVFAFLAMKYMPSADKLEISLTEMTEKAIEILSANKNGFFLMVEGAQIDWAGHRGDSEGIIRETIALDDAVGAALEFAKKNGDTLIIVTADHETGGYTVLDGSVKEKKVKIAVCASTWHTGNMVPVFAYGPGSEAFGGIHKNTIVGKTMIDYIEDW